MTTKHAGTRPHEIHATIQALVSNNFSGCSAEFTGDPSGNMRRRSFGFRIVDHSGKYRTDTIWVGPAFYHRPNRQWLLKEVARANSTLPAG